MSKVNKIESYIAIQEFISSKGYSRIQEYIEKLECEININENVPNKYYDHHIELSLNISEAYATVYYPTLRTIGLDEKVNSNNYLFIWDDVNKILSVRINDKLIKFR